MTKVWREGAGAKATSLQLQRPHVHRAWGHRPHPHLTGPDPYAGTVSAPTLFRQPARVGGQARARQSLQKALAQMNC